MLGHVDEGNTLGTAEQQEGRSLGAGPMSEDTVTRVSVTHSKLSPELIEQVWGAARGFATSS